jgi:hypothetical protein
MTLAISDRGSRHRVLLSIAQDYGLLVLGPSCYHGDEPHSGIVSRRGRHRPGRRIGRCRGWDDGSASAGAGQNSSNRESGLHRPRGQVFTGPQIVDELLTGFHKQ